MSKKKNLTINEKVVNSDKLLEEEEGVTRNIKGWTKYILPFIAISWACFQLSIASFLTLDSTYIRSIHLAFALCIVFLNYPLLKKEGNRFKFLSRRDKIPFLDIIFALLATFAALYIVIEYDNIILRYGLPNNNDIIIGFLLIILLLEATRRVIGPVLPIIALCFSLYSFLSPYMPNVLASKGTSINRYIGQMTMESEGIYGIPLDVSATIVFLFVLFGAMLDKAGGGKFFIQMALSLLGRFKGGPAKAAVLGSGLTGTFSGSSIANIVTTGTFTIPLMKKVGYPPTKAAAVEVAASTDGQLAPPIMGAAAFIIAEYVSIPYSEVIKAAAIPAFASYAALFYITHIEASKLGLKGIPKKELPHFWQTLTGGIHYLIPLLFLIYELMIVRHSPESAAFKAIVVMSIIMLFTDPIKAYKNKSPILPAFLKSIKNILSSFVSGSKNMVSVALATASAGIIVGIISLGLGGMISELISTISGGNVYIMLIVTALASLIIGMGLPTTATYIVIASLTAPVIVEVGLLQGFVVPAIGAHLFCFYFGILADDTPPVGLAAYTAAAIAKSKPIPTGIQGFLYDIRTAILPFMFIFNTDLILYGIDSWSKGILIFVMACLGNFAFVSATQGFFITKNKIYEIPVFLLITFIMFRPDFFANLIGLPIEQKYWMYAPGIIIYVLIFMAQKLRIKNSLKII